MINITKPNKLNFKQDFIVTYWGLDKSLLVSSVASIHRSQLKLTINGKKLQQQKHSGNAKYSKAGHDPYIIKIWFLHHLTALSKTNSFLSHTILALFHLEQESKYFSYSYTFPMPKILAKRDFIPELYNHSSHSIVMCSSSDTFA